MFLYFVKFYGSFLLLYLFHHFVLSLLLFHYWFIIPFLWLLIEMLLIRWYHFEIFTVYLQPPLFLHPLQLVLLFESLPQYLSLLPSSLFLTGLPLLDWFKLQHLSLFHLAIQLSLMPIMLLFHPFHKILRNLSLMILRFSVIRLRHINRLACQLILIQLLSKGVQISLDKFCSDEAEQLIFLFGHGEVLLSEFGVTLRL